MKYLSFIKWFFLLVKAWICRKTVYVISFTKEFDNKWYVDFPNWPLSHANLEMVTGAAELLNLLNDNTNHVKLRVSTKPLDHGIQLKKIKSSLTGGAFYIVKTPLREWESHIKIWLCPVTLAVLGRYPKTIYFKQIWSIPKKQ